ncbi:MAG TPA: sensor histidine kinase KdpD [Steroidobacteraceae bacterium]|jgi:two-component system sensor histidine kinase KdpD|nr:sensor histidine kinase KdpD [Steroidobacteraceae bacterium]
MAEVRPDPDQLLERVKAEEERKKRGRLRIFFGASAGVGKTYAMLEAARNLRAAGTEVLVGYVEPHGRIETERLMEGLPRLPTLPVGYRGIVRQEFDLDAALARRPEILLVDELAHSNLVGGEPAPRHPKRWQDIEELLAAGVGVWTTVNVQHLESLNDLIYQTTGIRQRETLPDHVFDEADDIELIDLPPDDLIARLHAGKVYVASQAGTAVERFFRKQNLMALREIALRRVADRVEAASRELPAERGQARAARDRVLVAVGPDQQAEQLVRAGKRMADALDAEWTVVYVETPLLLRLSDAQRNRRIDVLRLAESLGAESVTLGGPSAADALLEYAQTRHATRVIVGAPKRRGWRAWLRPSTATELVRRARGFDVVLIASAGRDSPAPAARTAPGQLDASPPMRWDRYAWAGAITVACTLLAAGMYPHFELSNLVMIYLLGVTVAGLRLGRGPSALTALLNVASFDFFFVPPRYSFAVSDVQYLVTFGAMVTIALVIATLTASVRQQTRVAGARERRTALLYAMSRELSVTRGLTAMARVAVRHVAEVFECRATVLLPDAGGKLGYPQEAPLDSSFRGADLAVAQWVADHGRRAGLGSDTLPAARGLYVPLGDEQRTMGVLAVLPYNARRVLLPEQSHLLETFAGQIAVALERAHLAEAAVQSSLAAERETLRNTLLSSISHDLRTPLAVMAGAGSTLAQHGATLDEATRAALARSVETTAREMSELVSNVLDLVRLESGQVVLRRDWQTLDDLLGSALTRYQAQLAAHRVETRLPADLPEVWVDATLIVQLLANLFDNIAKYTPPGTRVLVSAVPAGEVVQVSVEDDGPGLPAGDPARLFEKFQRGSGEGAVVGVGLGLAIAQAIVRAHGGEIEAQRREGGGARFVFTLPATEGPTVPPMRAGSETLA